MQGDDYVSLDADEKFLSSFQKIVSKALNNI